MSSPRGFGGSFPDLRPWRRWRAALRLLLGEKLERGDAQIVHQHTTAQPRYGKGYRRAAFVCGRQSGKSSVAALVALHEALSAPRPTVGEYYSLLVAQDERSAMKILLSYATALIEASPEYRERLAFEPRKRSLEFANGCSLLVLPSDPAAVRGYRAVAAIVDEAAYLGESDYDMVAALEPTLSSTEGRLILITSPAGPSGLVYDWVERDDPGTLIWRSPSYLMNPRISKSFLTELKRTDPLAYEREIMGEFGATEATLLDPAKIEAAVRSRFDLEPRAERAYSAFVDVSGGRHDRAALAIVHVEEGHATVDALHHWAPPFSPADFVESCLPYLARYRIHAVRGDQYAASINEDMWRERGIAYERSHLTRAQILLSMVPILGGGLCTFPDDALLVRELKALTRRTTRNGRELAEHPRSGSDDVANAVSGAIVHALRWRPDAFEAFERLVEGEGDALSVAA